jgi:hypothetical protein
MNAGDFEKQLKRQALRQVPDEWRAEILQKAEASTRNSKSAETQNPSWLSTLISHLSTILWPHPKAWAGLAAVWIVIGSLQFASSDHTNRLAARVERPSPESFAILRQQTRLLAELLGQSPPKDADRAKPNPSQPRSEQRTNTRIA